MPFSARALKKKTFFDVYILGKTNRMWFSVVYTFIDNNTVVKMLSTTNLKVQNTRKANINK